MNVLEIGSGWVAGPRLAGSDLYTVLDIDKTLIERAMVVGPDKTFARVVADAQHLPFADCSFDIVLARNFFGDPWLGTPKVERERFSKLLRFPMGKAINSEREAYALQLRRKIVPEVSRVLKTLGSFVIHEQYTEESAEEFVNLMQTDPTISPGLDWQQAELADILPENYANLHKELAKFNIAWVGSKNSPSLAVPKNDVS